MRYFLKAIVFLIVISSLFIRCADKNKKVKVTLTDKFSSYSNKLPGAVYFNNEHILLANSHYIYSFSSNGKKTDTNLIYSPRLAKKCFELAENYYDYEFENLNDYIDKPRFKQSFRIKSFVNKGEILFSIKLFIRKDYKEYKNARYVLSFHYITKTDEPIDYVKLVASPSINANKQYSLLDHSGNIHKVGKNYICGLVGFKEKEFPDYLRLSQSQDTLIWNSKLIKNQSNISYTTSNIGIAWNFISPIDNSNNEFLLGNIIYDIKKQRTKLKFDKFNQVISKVKPFKDHYFFSIGSIQGICGDTIYSIGVSDKKHPSKITILKKYNTKITKSTQYSLDKKSIKQLRLSGDSLIYKTIPYEEVLM